MPLKKIRGPELGRIGVQRQESPLDKQPKQCKLPKVRSADKVFTKLLCCYATWKKFILLPYLKNVESEIKVSLSCVQLFVTPLTVASQAPLSLEFSRQEYWSGLPCPSPRGLPHSGEDWTQVSCLLHWQVGSSPLAPPGKPI